MLHPLSGGLACPRGAVGIVRKVAEEDGVVFDFIDQRSRGVEIPHRDPRYTLRPYQVEARDAFIRATQGVIVIPCGGGKTTIGIDVINTIGASALVLVHTEDLHDQWLDAFQEKLGMEVGSVMGGKWKPQRNGITVASVPKLVRMLERYDPRAVELLGWPGVCVLDEGHHAPANTFQKILRYCQAKYRLALTATPTRDDGMTRLMDWSFGHRVFEITTDELVKLGHLIRPRLEVFETDFRFESTIKDDRKRTKAMWDALMEDDARVRTIAQLAVRDWKKKGVTLILANRKEYALKLSRAIWEAGAEASAITSDTLKSVRKTMMRNFRAGRVPITIATSLADEGLDCPSLTRIILAWPEAPRSRTIQRIGRLMRPYEEQPVFVDVVDRHVPDLVHGYEQREKIYRRLKMIRRKKGAQHENDESQMRFD